MGKLSKALSGRFRASCLERSDLTSGLLRQAMFWSSQKPSQQPCARIKYLFGWAMPVSVYSLLMHTCLLSPNRKAGAQDGHPPPSVSLSLSLSPTYVLGQASVLHVRLWTTAAPLGRFLSKPSDELLGQSCCIHALAGCNN